MRLSLGFERRFSVFTNRFGLSAELCWLALESVAQADPSGDVPAAEAATAQAAAPEAEAAGPIAQALQPHFAQIDEFISSRMTGRPPRWALLSPNALFGLAMLKGGSAVT